MLLNVFTQKKNMKTNNLRYKTSGDSDRKIGKSKGSMGSGESIDELRNGETKLVCDVKKEWEANKGLDFDINKTIELMNCAIQESYIQERSIREKYRQESYREEISIQNRKIQEKLNEIQEKLNEKLYEILQPVIDCIIFSEPTVKAIITSKRNSIYYNEIENLEYGDIYDIADERLRQTISDGNIEKYPKKQRLVFVVLKIIQQLNGYIKYRTKYEKNTYSTNFDELIPAVDKQYCQESFENFVNDKLTAGKYWNELLKNLKISEIAILVWREYDNETFKKIGNKLGYSRQYINKKFHRIVDDCTTRIKELDLKFSFKSKKFDFESKPLEIEDIRDDLEIYVKVHNTIKSYVKSFPTKREIAEKTGLNIETITDFLNKYPEIKAGWKRMKKTSKNVSIQGQIGPNIPSQIESDN